MALAHKAHPMMRLPRIAKKYSTLAAVAALAAGAAGGGCSSKTPSASPSNPDGTGAATSIAPGVVKLERGAHSLALSKYDVGPLDPNKRIENLSIVFKLSPAQQLDHDALLAAQLDPASPSYHEWLTPESYAARFGARPADIARTTDWLAARGLAVTRTSRLGARVSFGGTVGQLQDAFQAPMRSYTIGTETHYAMATAPSIPAALSDVVLAGPFTFDAGVPPFDAGAGVDGSLPPGDDSGSPITVSQDAAAPLDSGPVVAPSDDGGRTEAPAHRRARALRRDAIAWSVQPAATRARGVFSAWLPSSEG